MIKDCMVGDRAKLKSVKKYVQQNIVKANSLFSSCKYDNTSKWLYDVFKIDSDNNGSKDLKKSIVNVMKKNEVKIIADQETKKGKNRIKLMKMIIKQHMIK